MDPLRKEPPYKNDSYSISILSNKTGRNAPHVGYCNEFSSQRLVRGKFTPSGA